MNKQQVIEKYGIDEWNRRMAASKAYYYANREKCLERQKKYDRAHPKKDYMREYMRTYDKYGVLFAYVVDNDPTNIENYQAAKAEDFKGWCIHHRLETHNSDGSRREVDISRDELLAMDMYYNRPAEELIFMRTSDHISLHKKAH